MKNAIRTFVAALTVLVCVTGLGQSVPPLINYQGQLLDAGGTPMPTGDYIVEVRLFPVESGGVAIWGPQVFSGQSGTGFGPKIPVVNGRFNIILGPLDTSSNNLASAFAANPSAYVELKVGSASPISPRQQVLSAPFAFNSLNASNAVNSQTALSAQTAVNAQNASFATNANSATTAASANTANTALNANNAANAAKLNGYDWGTIFTGANPQSGTLTVENAVVRGDIQIGPNNYHTLTMLGGNSYGYLYGSYPALGDGLHLGYNWYYDANGFGHLFASGGGTSRVTVGYGIVSLFVGGVNAAPTTERLRATTAGVTVFGTFNNSSDRNAKQDFAPVSASQILEKVVRLPLSEWSYKTDPATRHIGPMGQDFYSAFNVGTDDKHIAPIDEGGVALAAIQALNQKLEQKEAQIRQLEQRLERFEQLLNQKTASER